MSFASNKKPDFALALGNFDGVHLGHQAVLKAAGQQKNRGLLPSALVMTPHPMEVLKGEVHLVLCEGQIRKRLFDLCGVTLEELDFFSIKDMSPEDFFKTILIGKYNAKYISCGYDYSFGSLRSGDIRLLKSLCSQYKVELNIIDEVSVDGLSVSSTKIREALKDGDLELANKMLGRAFSYDFKVVSGDRRGRLLGFPTINQFFPNNFMVPRHGVYASMAYAEGKWYDSVTNIGLRPTVGTNSLRSETCLLGYSGDLYGQRIEVRLFQYIREDKLFDSFENLSKQIKEDAKTAKEMLKNTDENLSTLIIK